VSVSKGVCRTIISCFVLCASAVHSPAQPPDPERVTKETPAVKSSSQPDRQDQQQSTRDAPLSVRVVEDEEETKRARDREERTDKREADNLQTQKEAARATRDGAFWAEQQTRAAWFQAVLATVGTIALFYTLYLTRMSVKAAHDGIRVAENASKHQLQAYAFMNNINNHWLADKATEKIIAWVFTPIWKNSGQTPTISAICNVTFGETSGAIPEAMDFADHGEPGHILLAPNAIMHAQSHTISVDKLKEMRAGRMRAFAWGWIEYSDVFEGTRRHRHEFCIEIKVVANPEMKEGGFAFSRHGRLNGYDEECYRQPTTKRGDRPPVS
jgi:hypothetical protein